MLHVSACNPRCPSLSPFRNKLIVWHAEEICKANFLDKAEVKQTAWLLVRSGEVVCACCSGKLTVHDCYSRHYRDESGRRHYGWIAQGHCDACNVYPSLTPSFIKPYKHYKSDVIERVIKDAEAGNNVENLSGVAADASTMRRWAREFKERGRRAVDCLISQLTTKHKSHVVLLCLEKMSLLQQLAQLLREYPAQESGGIIGNVNIILTTHNCGFL